MAIVKAPLLSLDARGKLGSAIVYSGWKGIQTARAYVIPANPNSTAQGIQRGFVTVLMTSYHTYFTNAIMRTDWNRLALYMASTMSGFNAWMKNALMAYKVSDTASFALSCAASGSHVATWTMKNLKDGTTGTEAGNYDIYKGTTPTNLAKTESVAIAAGVIVATVALGATSDKVYVKITKGGLDRSGLSYITLT
jgi:hypothetical protein